jgi:hypothetical protein
VHGAVTAVLQYFGGPFRTFLQKRNHINQAMFPLLAWLLWAHSVAAGSIPDPIVGPTAGFKPLRVSFSAGFTPNDTTLPIDIRYTINADIDFVSCTGSREQSIGSGAGTVIPVVLALVCASGHSHMSTGYRVFLSGVVLHVKTCYNTVHESDVIRVVITVDRTWFL